MRVVWAMEEPPERIERSMFLAGPTPRAGVGEAWRARALEALAELGYDGVVFVPEPEDGAWRQDYTGQVEWEERCLNMADAIVFWVPRELGDMPGFTTNIEWGVWHATGKVVLGAPPQAPKMRYMQTYAERLGVPQAQTLEETLAQAIALIGPGVVRERGERDVPLFVWRTEAFQGWYASHLGAGHRLDGARVEWHLRTSRGELFAWILRVKVFIPEEDRHKSGEVILGRLDTSSVMAFRRGATLAQTRVVLVREFRSAASGPDGYVWELPGGSSFEQGVAPEAQAVEELEEETGVRLDGGRLRAYGARQVSATLLTHQAHLYAVELTEEELGMFEAQEGVVHGAHDSERTMVSVVSVGELLEGRRVDWSVVGMILSVLA